jgi:prophage tail gpP-like protein
MADAHQVTLTHSLSGEVFDGVWDEYEIDLDMLHPGASWTVSMWHSDDNRACWARLRETVKCGDAMVLTIDGAPQLNGRVEAVVPQHSFEKGAQLVVSGRDLAGVAASWDAEPTISLRDSTLEDVLTQLFAPLGIRVVVGADADAARQVRSNLRPGPRGTARRSRRQRIDRFHVQPGEKVWQLAEKLCSRYGLLMWVGPDTTGQLAIIVDVPHYQQQATYQL